MKKGKIETHSSTSPGNPHILSKFRGKSDAKVDEKLSKVQTKEHLDEEKKRGAELQTELIETQGTLKEVEERMEIMLKEERRLVETVARFSV